MTAETNSQTEHTDVLIVGGGLSGLSLADALHRAGRSFVLLEARDRFGGRIKTAQYENAAFDLGPAWFWPGQPRMAALVDRFGLHHFDQFSTGAVSFEDAQGRVQRERGFASMQGSYRLAGGLSMMIDALAATLPKESLRTGHQVQALHYDGAKVHATVAGKNTIVADQVVLAIPPRVAADLSYDPTLPDASIHVMRSTATWMAVQAKAVAVYDTPFWRGSGLSGDAMSRFGPMVEVHDASPNDDGFGALFGFIGVAPEARADQNTLRHHILAQLERLFGEEAKSPNALFVKDWAFDPLTATKADHAPLRSHPTYGRSSDLAGIWDGNLVFAGTEIAPEFGGYLEGALEASELAFAALKESKVQA